MKNRIETSNPDTQKTIYESDKAFDESMISLIGWLFKARQAKLLSQEDYERIFKEELKARRGHDSTPQKR